MLRLGPITIMRTQTAKAYSNVVKAAWPVHQEIWGFGENNSWPPGLEALPGFDADLSKALSHAPIEDAPHG